jgi:hypothetical protein
MSLKWLALCLMAGGLAGIGGAYVLDFETWFPLDLILGSGGMLALGFGLILRSTTGSGQSTL